MDVNLVVLNEKSNAKQLRLANETIIGRGSTCNLRVSSKQVSRRHCLIRVDGAQVHVRDLGSSNGTLLDGETIAAETDVPVPPGGTLSIGPMRFRVEYEPPLEACPEAEPKPSTTHDVPPLLFPPPMVEEDTKDYVPSRTRRREADTPDGSDSGELDFSEGEPSSPAAFMGHGESDGEAPVPDATQFDDQLADHARDAARRARESTGPFQSGTDLFDDEAPAFAGGDSDVDPAEETLSRLAADLHSESQPAASTTETAPPRKGWNLLGFLKRGDRRAAAAPPAAAAELASPVPPPHAAPKPRSDEDIALQEFFKTSGP